MIFLGWRKFTGSSDAWKYLTELFTVCDEGYYRENGTCGPCESNTFKNVTGDDGRLCAACPYNTTSGPGSAFCGKNTFTRIINATAFVTAPLIFLTDTLIDRMGEKSIFAIKVPITIDIILNFDGEFDECCDTDGTCKQTLRLRVGDPSAPFRSVDNQNGP